MSLLVGVALTCALHPLLLWARMRSTHVPALLSSPLFIPHKLSLLFHHLQEVSPDFRPAWNTPTFMYQSWVGTKAVIRASALGRDAGQASLGGWLGAELLGPFSNLRQGQRSRL